MAHATPRTAPLYMLIDLNECLFAIEELLLQTGDKDATLESYGLPTPNRAVRLQAEQHCKAIRQELDFDAAAEKEIGERIVKNMNRKQTLAYHTIMRAVDRPKQTTKKFFSLQASAGTGKTFLCKALAATIRGRHEIALCGATSGIAATLMPKGRTMHSRFGIPLNVTTSSMLTIKKQSATADLIRRARIIIWDEAPMAHKTLYTGSTDNSKM